MTDAKHNELERLRLSEQKYRAMIQMASDAIFTIEVDTGRVLEVNAKAEELTGERAEELVGKTIWELYPKGEVATARRLFETVVKTGRARQSDMSLIRRESHPVEVEVSAAVIAFGDQQVIQLICHDISARHGLQRENARLRHYYESVLDMMPLGLGVCSNLAEDPKVEFENRRLREIISRARDEGCDNDWHDYDPTTMDDQNTVVNDDGVFAVRHRFPNDRWYEFTITYFRDLAGVWRELRVMQDVTQRQRLAEELKKANAELERKVEERTTQLRQKQAQLVQSEKMAALGNLVAGVAHEINTPLGALKSNVDVVSRALQKLLVLIEEPDCAEAEAIFERIRSMVATLKELGSVSETAAERIAKIVNSLRTFARLDQAEKDTVDIHEGLDSTLTLVHHELKNRIEVVKNYGDLPAVHCYPNQLNQVFMNILVNASQAIEGQGRITITTRRDDGCVVIEFKDTGKGISDRVLKRIFDPGYTTKGAGVGTGLGLSIVHQIMDAHRGRIDVESEVGKGSTFRLWLPLEES